MSWDIVLVVIFTTALWLQEGLSSHDLVLACVNGSLGYFPEFQKACQAAQVELAGYSMRRLLAPTGIARLLQILIAHQHRAQAQTARLRCFISILIV